MNQIKARAVFLGRGKFPVLLLAALLFLGSACSSKEYALNLMPAPEIHSKGIVKPLDDLKPEHITYKGILYATGRQPGKPGQGFYTNKRDMNLRLGLADVEVGDGQYTWEQTKRISLQKPRAEEVPLKITRTHEFGILDRSITMFTPPERIPEDPKAAGAEFARLINEKLAISKKKEINIYVHGYRVVFNNPILVAAELWHYTGYDGVFIAFSWPSTPRVLAYVADLETAAVSAHNLRILIEYLAEETDAEQINIIGYSAGTRVVLYALLQLAFMHHGQDAAAIRQKLRINRTVLIGSDFDRGLFGAYLAEGILKVTRTLTVYASAKDKALDFSGMILERDRVGQIPPSALRPTFVEYLKTNPELEIINVTQAEGSTTQNGHRYFRQSPWVSSDLLVSLMYNLPPDERGLLRTEDSPIWTFPPDYTKRLKEDLKKVEGMKGK